MGFCFGRPLVHSDNSRASGPGLSEKEADSLKTRSLPSEKVEAAESPPPAALRARQTAPAGQQALPDHPFNLSPLRTRESESARAASDGGKNNVSQLTSSVPSRRDVPAEAADDDLHPSTRGGADARPPADALRSMSHSARILFKSVSDRVLGGGRRRKARDAVLGKVLAEIRSLAGLIEENERVLEGLHERRARLRREIDTMAQIRANSLRAAQMQALVPGPDGKAPAQEDKPADPPPASHPVSHSSSTHQGGTRLRRSSLDGVAPGAGPAQSPAPVFAESEAGEHRDDHRDDPLLLHGATSFATSTTSGKLSTRPSRLAASSGPLSAAVAASVARRSVDEGQGDAAGEALVGRPVEYRMDDDAIEWLGSGEMHDEDGRGVALVVDPAEASHAVRAAAAVAQVLAMDESQWTFESWMRMLRSTRGHGDGGAARGIGTIPEEASGEVGRDSGGSGVMEKGGAKEGGHELYTLGGRERGGVTGVAARKVPGLDLSTAECLGSEASSGSQQRVSDTAPVLSDAEWAQLHRFTSERVGALAAATGEYFATLETVAERLDSQQGLHVDGGGATAERGGLVAFLGVGAGASLRGGPAVSIASDATSVGMTHEIAGMVGDFFGALSQHTSFQSNATRSRGSVLASTNSQALTGPPTSSRAMESDRSLPLMSSERSGFHTDLSNPSAKSSNRSGASNGMEAAGGPPAAPAVSLATPWVQAPRTGPPLTAALSIQRASIDLASQESSRASNEKVNVVASLSEGEPAVPVVGRQGAGAAAARTAADAAGSAAPTGAPAPLRRVDTDPTAPLMPLRRVDTDQLVFERTLATELRQKLALKQREMGSLALQITAAAQRISLYRLAQKAVASYARLAAIDDRSQLPDLDGRSVASHSLTKDSGRDAASVGAASTHRALAHFRDVRASSHIASQAHDSRSQSGARPASPRALALDTQRSAGNAALVLDASSMPGSSGRVVPSQHARSLSSGHTADGQARLSADGGPASERKQQDSPSAEGDGGGTGTADTEGAGSPDSSVPASLAAPARRADDAWPAVAVDSRSGGVAAGATTTAEDAAAGEALRRLFEEVERGVQAGHVPSVTYSISMERVHALLAALNSTEDDDEIIARAQTLAAEIANSARDALPKRRLFS